MVDDGEEYTVVLYARVSTDDKGQTNETQIRELKEYCQRKGYVIADGGEAIYTDEQTGKNDKRRGFREMKGRISEGDIDYVVARNQDRISREPADYQQFLDYTRASGSGCASPTMMPSRRPPRELSSTRYSLAWRRRTT